MLMVEYLDSRRKYGKNRNYFSLTFGVLIEIS